MIDILRSGLQLVGDSVQLGFSVVCLCRGAYLLFTGKRWEWILWLGAAHAFMRLR
jgi:hypothetical protein